jgi:formylmethanofuran dehydrogenase subunit E
MGAFEIEFKSEAELPRGVWERMSDKVRLFEHLEGCIVTAVDEIPNVWHIFMADQAVECPSCHEMIHHRVGLNITDAVCIECNGGTIHEKQ